MKLLHRLLATTAVLAMTYLFTSLWLGSSLSERLWSWLNASMSSGTNPGLASDVEFVLALVGALLLSVALLRLLLMTWRCATNSDR